VLTRPDITHSPRKPSRIIFDCRSCQRFDPQRPQIFPKNSHSSRAGDGNRTHVTSLEGWSSTIELRPRTRLLLTLFSRNCKRSANGLDERKSHLLYKMGEVGFEPTKAEPPDLQSGPFDHSGIPPRSYGPATITMPVRTTECHSTSAGGHTVWASTVSRGASGGNRTRNLRFTKPELYR
jgi:hypothetical protein